MYADEKYLKSKFLQAVILITLMSASIRQIGLLAQHPRVRCEKISFLVVTISTAYRGTAYATAMPNARMNQGSLSSKLAKPYRYICLGFRPFRSLLVSVRHHYRSGRYTYRPIWIYHPFGKSIAIEGICESRSSTNNDNKVLLTDVFNLDFS